MRRLALAIAALALASTGAYAKIKTPKHVKMVSRNNPRGIPSPDGTRFLYDRGAVLYVANVDNAKVVQKIKVPKTRCGRGYCDGMGVIDYAWAPDGKSIAYSVDTGKKDTGLYHYDLVNKRAERVTKKEIWEFGFDSAGEVIYMTGVVRWGAGRDAAVWRAGESKPFLSLPNRGENKLGGNSHIFELRRDLVLTTVQARHAKWNHLELTEVWITELSTGTQTQLAIPRGSSGVTMAPGEDRVCYYASSELRCLDPQTGADDKIMGKRACGWGVNGIAAWSPSGRRLAFRVCNGNTGGVAVHDFDDGASKVLLADTTYRNLAFQTESALLLLKSSMPKHSGRTHEGIARIDVDTGDLFGIVADDTQYPYAFPIPGRDDVTYVARDRESTTDLAWIDTSKPIGPAPTMAKPVTGKYVEHHANGTTRSEVHLRKGELHGVASFWDWDGNKLERGSYDGGKKSGTWTTWFPKGHKESVIEWDAGKRHGTETLYWRDTKHKSKVAEWKRGVPYGAWRSFHKNGKKAMAGKRLDKGKVGTWTRWYDDGTKREEIAYLDGKKHGVQNRWSANGKLSETGEYVNGKREGLWRWYERHRSHWREVVYENDREVKR